MDRGQLLKRFFLTFLSGAVFLFASLFCFTALNSYTYIFLVKAPPYPWVNWFARNSACLYWLALAAGVVSQWEFRRRRPFQFAWFLQVAIGCFVTLRNAVLNVRNDGTALGWAIALILPALGTYILDLRTETRNGRDEAEASALPYFPVALVVALAGIMPVFGGLLRNHLEGGPFVFHKADAEVAVFAFLEYAWFALLILSSLNLFQYLVAKALRASWSRSRTVFLVLFVVLYISFLRFLNSTLSLNGWPVYLYSTVVVAFTLAWGGTLWNYAMPSKQVGEQKVGLLAKLYQWAVLVGIVLLSLFFPAWLGSGDWNGLIAGVFYLFYWTLLGLVVYRIFPGRVKYSISLVLPLILGGCVYGALQTTTFLWAHDLAGSNEDLSLFLQQRREKDDSWQLIDKAFHYQKNQSCGDLCRTLRQYSNLPNALIHQPVQLVTDLRPTSETRPNIFIFVVDSLRPDYLGTYNSSVDFTPNLDSFAHDSVVMRNAFTQYAGTSLSEPAIWTGALLLHSHYMRPFSSANNLRSLASTDGYDVAVSYDHILRRVMPETDNLTRFDVEKDTPKFEISSTLQQLTSWMDRRDPRSRPILFYAQPMNVHELASNNLAPRTAANWNSRPGFNNRIAYRLHQADESFGGFIQDLKRKGIYDSSVIIVTSDHGDALETLPGFGMPRRNHSTIIFPEVMRVPLIIHLPTQMRGQFVWDVNRLTALTDITPSLYYLLGHRPLNQNPIFGQPIFVQSSRELATYHRDHLFFSSDTSAHYGMLTGDGRYFYALYDAPLQSLLFDLRADPEATHNIATVENTRQYNRQILADLNAITDFYGYRPTGGNEAHFGWDSVVNWH